MKHGSPLLKVGTTFKLGEYRAGHNLTIEYMAKRIAKNFNIFFDKE
jgi:hypothetical protein